MDQSVFLPAGDRAEIERLVAYMTRCPFSLPRLVKVSEIVKAKYWGATGSARAKTRA